jgi:predicted transcriptional regulator
MGLPVSEHTPSTDEPLRQRQQAYLLQQLVNAGGALLQSTANKAIPKQIQKELGLTGKRANEVRATMAASGWLTEEKINRVVKYSITDLGRNQLRDLERFLPLLPAKGEVKQQTDDWMRTAREAYVLTALDSAPGQTISKSDLEIGFGGKAKPKVAELKTKHPHLTLFRDQSCLGLNPATTRAVLSELALRGDIQVSRAGGSESYSLTREGTALLERVRNQCPILPPTGKPAIAPNESVRRGREAFLLLKLLQSAKYALWGSDSAAGSYPKQLKLNHATAWKVRDELVREGHISIVWEGKEACYTLTPKGKAYLTTLPFDAIGEVKLRGSALTELLAAARESPKVVVGEASTRAGLVKPDTAFTKAQLEAAVMGLFHELFRERFGDRHMVPIHEIRRALASRFGPHNASHKVLDEVLLGLRQAKSIGRNRQAAL